MSKEEVTKGIPKKKRKVNKKRGAFLIIVFFILVVSIILVIKNLTQKKENIETEEEYVQILADGTKINKSKKLSEEKQVEGLTISNIQLTEKDNVSVILADVTNHSNEAKGGFAVDIQLIDESGETITTIVGFIPELQANETTQLNTQTTLDFANSYDITIQKKEM